MHCVHSDRVYVVLGTPASMAIAACFNHNLYCTFDVLTFFPQFQYQVFMLYMTTYNIWLRVCGWQLFNAIISLLVIALTVTLWKTLWLDRWEITFIESNIIIWE